jgi:hypothetical protein
MKRLPSLVLAQLSRGSRCNTSLLEFFHDVGALHSFLHSCDTVSLLHYIHCHLFLFLASFDLAYWFVLDGRTANLKCCKKSIKGPIATWRWSIGWCGDSHNSTVALKYSTPVWLPSVRVNENLGPKSQMEIILLVDPPPTRRRRMIMYGCWCGGLLGTHSTPPDKTP